MNLHLYDTLRRTVAPVVPVTPGRLGIYVCGPTVYERIHVGNARPYVVGMTLRRHLRRGGVEAVLVSNITDVNDKIYTAAALRGVPSLDHAAAMTAAYREDTDRLGLGRPDVEPLVTESMPAIIALIETLLARGLAYPTASGDVYFRVGAFPSYGALSGQRPEEMAEEGRVEHGEGKLAAVDFALWKARKSDEDSSWPSPWGDGRPGWHIECSAMARAALGDEIDVHGGGLDLIFPHHENERAQSEGASQHRFVRNWLHNGMLRFHGEKMSKSIGNIERLADALDRHGPETLLMLFAQAHYRSPMEYTDATLAQSRAAADRLRETLHRARSAEGGGSGDTLLEHEVTTATSRFDAALDNDLRTPEALAALFDLARTLNAAVDSRQASARAMGAAADALVQCLDVLGLATLDSPARDDGEVPETVRRLIDERAEARARGDWSRSDAIRGEIAGLGWVLRDTPNGADLTRG